MKRRDRKRRERRERQAGTEAKRKEGKMSLVPVYVIDGVIDPEIKYLTTSKRLSSPPNEGECYSPPRLPKSAYHLPRATDIAKRGVPEGDLSLRRPGFLSTVAVAGSLPSNSEVLEALLQLPGAKLGGEATFMDVRKREVMRFGWTGLCRQNDGHSGLPGGHCQSMEES